MLLERVKAMEFPETLIVELLDLAETNRLSASVLHILLRQPLTDAARTRRARRAAAGEVVKTDKRLKTYVCVGEAWRSDGARYIPETTREIVGLAGVNGVMRDLVAFALPGVDYESWGAEERMRGARVALSNSGVGSFHFTGAQGKGATVHVHSDPQRAENHLRQLQRETRNKFVPGKDDLLNLIRPTVTTNQQIPPNFLTPLIDK